MVSTTTFYFKHILKQNKSKAEFFLYAFTEDTGPTNTPMNNFIFFGMVATWSPVIYAVYFTEHGKQHWQIWKYCNLHCLFHCNMLGDMNLYGSAVI